jgi:nucleoside phosphorylase
MDDEEVVMTPSKKGKTTVIRIEKVRRSSIDQTQVAHKAGGQHSGLVINKQTSGADEDASPHLQLEFKCFLVDQKTGSHVPESRTLKFWFAADTIYLDRVTSAYEFFKELVRPDQFPRDYVGFIKKVMKQLQQPRYVLIRRTDCDLRQLDEQELLSATPGMMPAEDKRPRELIVQEQLLHFLESAYPNILPTDDLADMLKTDSSMVTEQLQILMGRNLIKEMEPGKFVRNVLDKTTEVKIVKQMPVQTPGKKPTIAIITSKYYEKLAVDAMMDDKTTFVKYKTEGESNVYTIGYIGQHKVVSTKLPAIGRQMAAQISSGNTTTRLLGTFSDVEHVLLVGVCGGVPHYADYYSHVRLGDVVVSAPNDRGQLFIYCDKVTEDAVHGALQYSLKSWSPVDLVLLTAARSLVDCASQNPDRSAVWEEYITAGSQLLRGQEVAFERPPQETDRLFMNLGGDDMIEVGHPAAPPNAPPPHPGQPTIRFGAIASGKPVVMGDQLRLDFAARHQCVANDTEFDQVLESIVGNRKDSFLFVRGVADYLDGSKNAEWQPYAALVAAAFTRAIIDQLPPAS